MSATEGVARPDSPPPGGAERLPWRGPGLGRPDLPLPPEPMPVLRGGRLRKRWRYIGLYAPEVMLCAARIQVGPFEQSFWALWDREQRNAHGRTRLRPSAEVTMDGPELSLNAPGASARLRLGEAEPVEAVCPSGERGGYGWTRKRAGIPIRGTVEAGGRRWEVDGTGVDDESAGYHQRHTSWHWSAGVGSAADGTAVAWNLVEGINDPPQQSERGVWVEGVPHEPQPVSFSGLDSVEFADGSQLSFERESERARSDNMLVFRSHYRHWFGTFTGSLDGIELEQGFGVMEKHEVVW